MTTVSKSNSVSNPVGGPSPLVDPQVWPQIAHVPGGAKVAVAAPVADFLFRRAVARLQVRVAMPDGEVIGAGSAEAPLMTVHRPHDFAARVGDSGLIGFGEAYMAGDWDAEDLTAVLEVFARRMASLIPKSLQRLRGLYIPKPPRSERNTTKNTRSNISRHYDLSNDLFELFLDETMTYSSALFAESGSGDDSAELADAQRRKIDRLLDRAGVPRPHPREVHRGGSPRSDEGRPAASGGGRRNSSRPRPWAVRPP